MKILVFSDSHGRTSLMESITKQYEAEIDAICFLGDVMRDYVKLREGFPHITTHAVPGNCDPSSKKERVQMVEIGGAKILLTHGHLHGVKRGYDTITAFANGLGADACFFGHSHVPVTFERDGVVFLNPGSITEPRGSMGKSFAVVTIEKGVITPEIIEA